ncbi:MAG: GNAT family N-acetyltransferase, partial [Bacillota bacterium]|nr:GNAT family N-acetyltransferase [Bacillota bacterium]
LFEKADTAFAGAYAAINYLFANAHYANVPIINRQEDLGIPELRKAKLSYHPIAFAEKYALMRNHLDPAVLADLRSLYAASFPDAARYVDFFFDRKYRSDNVVARMQDGHVVSALHFIRKSLSVRGMEYQLPFIAAAATRAEMRHKGHMSAVVRQALGELYNRKTVLCAIASMDAGFYEKFGFTSVSFVKTVHPAVPLSDGRTYRAATPEDLPLLDQLYHARVDTYDVFVERKLDVWQDYFDEVLAQDGQIVLVFEGDNPIGYFTRIGDLVEECVLKNDDLAMTLSAFDQKAIELEGGPTDASAAMIRIVDVVRFLETYPYNPDTFCSHRMKIIDDFFPQNNVTVDWTVEEGVVRVRRIDVYDETLTIRELTERAFVTGDCPFGRAKTIIFDRY